MDLRIKQLNLFESSGRLSEAYSYAINIEKTSKFQKDNAAWYDAVSKICEVSIINHYLYNFIKTFIDRHMEIQIRLIGNFIHEYYLFMNMLLLYKLLKQKQTSKKVYLTAIKFSLGNHLFK